MPRTVSPRLVLVATAALATVLGASACQSREDEETPSPAAMDTTNKQWEDGLSGQQVQQSASTMSPEEAEQRGLVDTTIHMENLGNSDSVDAATAAGPSVAQPDTTPRGDGRVDTLRGGRSAPGTGPTARPGGAARP